MTRTTPTDARAQAVAWVHAQQALAADRTERWAHGTIVRTPTLSGFWDLNLVRVEDPDPGLDAASLMAVADELQAGLRHRKLELEDEAAGTRLRPAFRAAGWRADRLAVMRRVGAPPPAPAHVDEVPYADTRALRIDWSDDDVLSAAAFAQTEERVAARRRTRAFVVRDGGRPVGFGSLVSAAGEPAPAGGRGGGASRAGDGAAVELAELFVSAAHRGRGHGTALIAAALAAGGAETAWVVADDEGDARRLYERMGFRTAWIQHTCVLPPAT